MNVRCSRVRDVVRANLRAYGGIVDAWERSAGGGQDADLRLKCRELFMKHLRGSRVLDVGCGPGVDSLAFAASGLKTTAADFVVSFLAGIGDRKGGRDIPLVGMDMTLPCFAPSSFDGIYAFASFLHVPGEAAFDTLSGFAEMLVPGGILFLHHAASTLGLSEYAIDDLLRGGERALAFCHSEDEMSSLLESAGFPVMALHHLQPAREPSALARRYGLAAYQIVAEKNSQGRPDDLRSVGRSLG